ncbi:hypothetical protein GRJ2_003252700 [Grus japonensis]|uniref:ribonuclease H n=1 Tax=Grus japonensis TaxID=30415 RepID=A0ABC9YEX8_GRUJA
MQKDFSHLLGEHIITWLLQCWDNGASSLELEGREAKQLGSLSREGGMDKEIGKKTQGLSLLRRLLLGVKERHPFSEDVVCWPGKWTTMERGIQYLRELAVWEVVYFDRDNAQLPTDPYEVKCARPMWWKFVWGATSLYANSLAVMDWEDKEAPTVDKMASFRQYEESLSSSLISTVPGRPQFAFPWRGVQYTWNRLPQGWKHSPTICRGLIQAALEQGEAPEHLQYIDDIIVWGNSAEEVSEKGKKLIQILLKAGFTIKQSKVKGPAQEIQFSGIRWHDGHCQIPMDIINKTAAMSPPTNKKETEAFLGVVGFWRMHIPNYSLIVSPLYHVTRKKNDFKWGPEQRQAFEEIKQEIVHAAALGPVRAGPDVKNVLYTAAGENGPTWSLWQKAPGETRGKSLGFWSWGYRGSEARYTPTEKEILAAYEGVRAASEVIGTEAQLLLAPRLPVLGSMFKERGPFYTSCN